MGLYIVPAGDDKPPQGSGRRWKEIASLQTGMFNPINHFLLPLCLYFCSLAWHHLLLPLVAMGDKKDSGQGLEHLSVPPICQDESWVTEMHVKEHDGSDGQGSDGVLPLSFFYETNNFFSSTLVFFSLLIQMMVLECLSVQESAQLVPPVVC